MILEVADIRILPGRQAGFERAAHHGIRDVIARSKGFQGYEVRRSIESPERYLLLLHWETLEDHTVGFRGSAAHAQWRSLVAEFFAQQPVVEHFTTADGAPFDQAAALDPQIKDFSDCHLGIVKTLDDLMTLSRQGVPEQRRRELAGQVLDFFRDVVAAHHSEEEADLFQAVLADATAGDEHSKVATLVARLVDEHRRIESMYSPLAPMLAAIKSGNDVVLDASAVEALVTDYRAHARFEEEVFLPLAQSILGRNRDHMAALGLALHIRHASEDVRRKFGFI